MVTGNLRMSMPLQMVRYYGIPSKPNIILKQMPFVGENATFTCNSTSTTIPSNHSLSLTYTWIMNGLNLPEDERYSYASNKMTITNIVKVDVDSRFRCSVKENLGYSSDESKIFSFNVYYGPDIAMISADSPYHITEGEVSKEITCTSTCNPGCTYKWTHIPIGLSVGVNGVLSFNQVNRSVAGDYECTIRNTAAPNIKYVSKNVKIIVYYPPTVTIRSSVTDIKEGHEMTLFCEGNGVPSNNTYISFTQTFNQGYIPNRNSALNGTDRFSTIHFSSLSFQDTGLYTCMLKNGIRNKNGEINQSGSKEIFVEALPKILTDDLRFTGSTEGVGRIEISIYSYPALSQVTLLRHNQNVLSSDKKYVSEGIVRSLFYGRDVLLNGSIFEFEIHDLTKIDFGNYTLNLKNSIGTTKAIVSIIAEGKPSSPTSFQYLPGKNIPSFIWEKNFNGGLEQSFIIQTSVAGKNIWTNRTLISESDEKYQINDTYFSTEVHGLEPGIYTARLISKNLKGESDIVELGKTFEVFKPTENQKQTAAIVGGCVAATVVVLVGLIVLIMIRRAKKMRGTKPGSQKARSRNDGLNKDKNDEESEVNTVNPMYVSADDMPDNTYAQPVKKKKAPEAGDVYAVVKKKTMHDKKEKRNVHAKKAEQDIPTPSK
ncbi:hemicentin-1-like, partial [Ruditapes philippinarum]|uniref:hemicentin-1-like n=1 Tax=Ruditapes philippinarum TaxID=129788 RepID=UPI00295BD807